MCLAGNQTLHHLLDSFRRSRKHQTMHLRYNDDNPNPAMPFIPRNLSSRVYFDYHTSSALSSSPPHFRHLILTFFISSAVRSANPSASMVNRGHRPMPQAGKPSFHPPAGRNSSPLQQFNIECIKYSRASQDNIWSIRLWNPPAPLSVLRS